MGKRIILLSDGTGNTPNKVWRSNVWRVFQSLDRTKEEQHPLYDDGVGTSSFIPFALIGGMFGWGLKRNVIDLYKFVARNYEPDAEIFAFGFSRGAFTINTVVNLLAHQGCVKFESENELGWKAKAAYRAYRRERCRSLLPIEYVFSWIRDFVIARWIWPRQQYSKEAKDPPTIRFVGLWDSVGAYGLPLESMTRAVSRWFWPLDLPNHELPDIVKRACHAVSLDDERLTFHPILWNERCERPSQPRSDGARYTEDERITQVWFAGSHSNIGGGYPDDSLAHVSLCWILHEACRCGLKLNSPPDADPDAMRNFDSIRDRDGRVYDSRKGIRSYYRYSPRKLDELCHKRFSSEPGDEVEIEWPKIHESVFERMKRNVQPYAPIGIPEKYDIIGADGKIYRNCFETLDKAQSRAKAQERVWDLVWRRSVLSTLIKIALLCFVLYPLFFTFPAEGEHSTPLRPVSDLVRLLGSFLPNSLEVWINAYAESPFIFLSGVVLIFALYRMNSKLKMKITDEMRRVWSSKGNTGYSPGLVYRIRTSPLYLKIRHALILGFFPNIFVIVFGLILAWLVVIVGNRILFSFEDAFGLTCQETGKAITLMPGETKELPVFNASAVCQNMGVLLNQDATYNISFKSSQPFRDLYASNKYSVGRFNLKWTLLPFRRILSRPWFTAVARIGRRGAEEYFFDPGVEIMKATKTGELFLYVNDAIIAFPGLYDLFYKNNAVSTKVEIKQCPC